MSFARRIRTDGLPLLLRLTLVAVGATLSADAVNQWLLSRWPPPPLPTRGAAPVAVEPAAPKAPASFSAISRRDIFNSAPSHAPSVTVAPTSEQHPMTVVQPLNLNVRLTGTVVGSAPADSFAMILDVAAREERLFRLGDKVQDEGVVTEIKRDMVRLKRGEAEQVLRMFEEGAEEASVQVSSTSGALAPEQVAADEFRFAIDRGEVEEALSDMPRLLTQARLLPNFRAGQTDGFRIFNIVPGSIFARIGLQNGDVLHRINDIPIQDPTKFMGVFEELKNESRITVDLVRNNARKTFEYEIR